ncbi:PREDICTED: tubby-related protein 4 isoform X1 [Lepidothrix coronata]|uniref:Tubby-related protein 4 n=1 Tax=Lepidothrix coronata TaxID=321398 RepID=A0A6J0IUU5_9PASS|nr:PREDICTED: tubby-related protein 4 isoform X1 [Lepidothrix coronata]XP_017690409.1 PREDICTED: tubby-related protein 4 isoform X1 [Lepidothrix coronata]XP_017690410.1 PREDICTED: tubby-related protein 4 isoform X1 [Lepidothrix coronata]XP_017690411.1 PREDICTED: tubby-related protein 4 isoform X1 [Lepidothrix coronata]XP_017690412.1 PREDICTED: tubby-related protein 4 isoform X1 [Lepidothrix coronata]XP_017690413.1 PREDICTED: tubby-related protein 4 isoform X1 [Lepidothrix coronata]
MYAAVEHGPVLCSDSNILCLSWKGRVPKSEKEKPVCRRRYYEEGWLATGNGRGVVGVTFTSSHCRRDRNTPQRINFNLRGHNSEVVLVRWNEPFQKLATCDADGGIFVWIQYEGRWSVELVNDRGAQVSDFTWSHDGTQALISYRDGFVLVGSVSGQRHWSSEINLESQITCGIWTPDDQQVLFGTADGQVIVMDCHGRMLAHVLLHESDGILNMSWNYPSFLVEDSSESDTDSDDYSPPQDGPAAYPVPVQNTKPLLTVSFTSGDISLMNNYDDLSPTIIRSGLKDVVVQWCTQGDLLAVAGMEKQNQLFDLSNGSLLKSALVKFYNVRGEHIYTLETPVQRPIISICWGHRDSRLLMASGPALYVVRVEHRVSSLQLLCQQTIASCLRDDKDISKLTLPPRLCSYLTTAFIPTIKPPIPDPNNMRDFVSYPTAGNERLHCTMKRTEDDPEVGGPCYTLYLEYLGGLVPILKGRRISKLRPEFVIMDPKTDGKADEIYGNSLISTVIDSCNCSDSSDIELSDDWAAKKSPKISRASKSPKLPRINIEARKSPKMSRAAQEISRSPRLPIRKPSIGSPSLTRREFPLEDITQHNYLAQVTSNIWGTKFKIVGLAAFLPTNLGAVIYKTSLLHLQPRQMTIYLPEVRKISMDYINMPVFNPNVFSEDEDDLPVPGAPGAPASSPPCTVNIPIAPIHSSAQAMSPTQSIGLVQSLLANQNVQLDVLANPPAEAGGEGTGPFPGAPGRFPGPGAGALAVGELSRPAPPPPPLAPPPPAPPTIALAELRDHSDREHEPPPKAKAPRPGPQLVEGDAVIFGATQELQLNKMNPPPPYPGTIPAPPTLPPPPGPPQPPLDLCLKKGEFSLYPAGHYQTPLGYERITTFDSSGNVEEVCRPRTRMLCAQSTYTLPGPGSSATLRITAAEKKMQQPCASATLNRLTVPRYSIPTGDPPPYPDIASQLSQGRSMAQRLDNTIIHATLRRNSREAALKMAQLMDGQRATLQLPPKPKSSIVTAQYQQRVPTALYTCSQCSSGGAGSSNASAGGAGNIPSASASSSTSSIGGVRPDLSTGSGSQHSSVIAHSVSTSPLASQSSYSLLSPPDNSRDRADYINSAFTEDEALSQHCPVEKSIRHAPVSLTEATLAVKRPPPYQWDPMVSEEIWVPQERTSQSSVPNPLKPAPLIIGQTQHLDMSRVPFVSPKSPTSPTATFQTSYGVGVPYPGSYSAPPLQGMQAPCSPKEALAPTQFAQQEPTVVLQPGYPSNLSYCPLPPMYPGSSTCSSLQLPPIALHPWSSYSACPPVQNPPGTLPPKPLLVVEKPVMSPPPAELQGHVGTEVMVETADTFQEVLSLTESPVPQRTDKFSKKSRKRLDSRAEEGNMQAITEGKVKKEARTLTDFNSLISSPRLGREKKKVKSQKDQLKSKKLNKTNEFQDSSESEPELFISGDELMNQSQGSKKGWKTKRSLRTASELDEFKCRKASEKEDGRLGSQGFVYVMANKQPLWNEATQVYQLDFGGRVTQESAKNFQIELEGRQVMQFGRIDGNAYILDFQYPFSAVQAFAVALANVTQRLK